MLGKPADHEGDDDEDEHLDDFLLVLLTPRPRVVLLPGNYVVPQLSGVGIFKMILSLITQPPDTILIMIL